MLHSEMINHIARSLGLKQADVRSVLDLWGQESLRELAMDEDAEVSIPHIGKLSTSNRAERQGRNPKSGTPITIKAHRVVKLSTGKEAKETLNP